VITAIVVRIMLIIAAFGNNKLINLINIANPAAFETTDKYAAIGIGAP
jgi:hypothetical protein